MHILCVCVVVCNLFSNVIDVCTQNIHTKFCYFFVESILFCLNIDFEHRHSNVCVCILFIVTDKWFTYDAHTHTKHKYISSSWRNFTYTQINHYYCKAITLKCNRNNTLQPIHNTNQFQTIPNFTILMNFLTYFCTYSF